MFLSAIKVYGSGHNVYDNYNTPEYLIGEEQINRFKELKATNYCFECGTDIVITDLNSLPEAKKQRFVKSIQRDNKTVFSTYEEAYLEAESILNKILSLI